MPVRPLALLYFMGLLACTAGEPAASPVAAAAAVPAPGEQQPAPVPASAPDSVDLNAVNALLRRCNGGEGHPLGTATAAERLGPWGEERVFLARSSVDPAKRVLLFDAPGDACPAFVLSPVDPSTAGNYLADGVQRPASLLSQAADGVSCDDDACPVAVVVRDPDGAIVTAMRPGLECSESSLTRVALLAGGDSLELRCRTGSVDGADKIVLLHATDRALRPLLSFDAALISVSPEDEARICTLRSSGGYTVRTTGANVVLDVLEVTALKQGVRTQWSFSPTEGRLLAGARRDEALPVSRTCEPL